MKSSKKLLIALCVAVLTVVVLIGSAFALFTDTEQGAAQGMAGTVDLKLEVSDLENKCNINPGDHDPSNPPGSNKGTNHSLVFKVTNNGSKSVYNRNVIVLSLKDQQNKGWLDARVIRLYETTSAVSDNTKVIGKEVAKKYYVKDDYTEIAATIDGSGVDVTVLPAGAKIIAIKYVIDKDKNGKDQVLNGDPTKPLPEVETGYTSNSATYHYLFSMDRTADNTYQGANIKIDIISQAMQFRNAIAGDWQTIATKSIATSASGFVVSGAPTTSQDKNGSAISYPVIP